MRYRPIDPATGDYTVGLPFLVNSPVCVAQAIYTRLLLWQGEWFVDTSDGTPYNQSILGHRAGSRNTQDASRASPDTYIKQRILETPGVRQLSAFSATYDGNTRSLIVSATVDTIYGQITVTAKI